MSTSDAAERRSEGRETEPPLTAERARTATARERVETLSDAGLSTEQSSTEKHTIQTKTHFSLNLGRRPSEKAESILLDTSTKSFHGPFPACSKNIVYRVHDLAVHAVDKIPLPLKTVIETKNCISIETSSRTIQSFPNGLRGPYHTNASRCEEPAKRANSLDLNVDKARAKELSGHSAMLSSTVVTVMAPHWSGRLRRSKREGMSDFQGNLQTRTEISSDVERMLSSGLQSQHRAPFVRSNTVGWSARSGPTSLDNERTMLTSASLDNKRTDRPIPSPLSPLSPHSPLSPLSPMSIDLNEPQRSAQRGHSPLSSKPTTSSMLLSLRRVNSPMSPTENQTQSPENVDPNRQFSTQYSQNFQHTNQLSPTSISSNVNASQSASPTHRDGLSKSYSYSTVPTKHTESLYSQCKTSKEVMPPQRSLSRDHPDSISKKPLTLPKRTPYDHTALLKSNSTPRRPLLSTITWMPTDNKESSTQVTSNINNKSSMRLITPFNSNDNHKDNAGIRGEVPNYRGNKNMAERSGNLTPQGGPAITENSPNNQSSQLKPQIDSCWNRDPPKPMSLPGALSNSKFSIAATHTAVSQAIPTNHNTSSGLYTTKGGEFTPTLLSPNGSYMPTDNSSKYQNMYSALKTPSAMPQYKEKLTKQSHLNDITNAVTNANYKSSVDLGQNSKTSCLSAPTSSISSSREEPLSPKFTPLGFERSYVPKPYLPKTNLSPTFGLYSKTNYSPTHNGITSSSSYRSPQSPPVTASALLTPPTTPNYNSPSSPRTPSPIPIRATSNSMDYDPKIQNSKGEKKPTKRVTFEDALDTKTEEKKQETLNQLSARNVKAPSIFNVLRSGNPPSLFSPTPKSSSIQVGAGTKYRSMSSDSAEMKSRELYKQLSTDSFDHKMHGLNMPRQERTLSAESATQYRCSAPLSLPPDFSNGYKNRYSSPPYSTLVTSRTSQQESKPKPPHSPLFQRHSHPNVPNSTNATLSIVKNPLLTTGSVSFRPVQIDLKDSSKDLNLDQVNNNPVKLVGEILANGHIQLVDNRVQVSSQSLPGDKSPRISSCVTETLVYSVRGRQDRAPKTTAIMPVAKDFQLCQQVQRKEAMKEQDNMSNLSSSSSVESQNIDDDNSKRKIKAVGKSRFYSIECNSEQSPKRSRFALKKSSSTPNAGLIRFDSEKTSKMDQMISKIKKTFSSKKPNNEEESFPNKWKKAAASDSSTSDVTVESNKTLEEEDVTMELNNNDKGVEDKQRWVNNRYTLVQTPKEKNKIGQDKFSMWSDEVMADTDEMHENRSSPHLRMHSPNQDLKAFDFKPNQFLSPNDSSSVHSHNSSSALRKSSASPRSPLSPFTSLSPVSPFSSTDMLDDSVFYSPKPPRQRDSSSSPCELGEISLVSSRRNRASTGPPSAGPVTGKERMSHSYADLKYGIEPGRSFSVSSVLSSRPSGPGRISTGSRFMSVGDLTKTGTFSCGHTSIDLENSSGQHGHETSSQSGRYSNDRKVRSRSLPRSFTQLSSWSAGKSSSNPAWGQSMDIVDISWDTEAPPTPPPTPPLSPVTRRMSKPRCLSPPSFSGRSDSPQDGQCPRGHLPSRGYLSSLSTFEESSDSSSDTTTDDEYYLETVEDEEKETEL